MRMKSKIEALEKLGAGLVKISPPDYWEQHVTAWAYDFRAVIVGNVEGHKTWDLIESTLHLELMVRAPLDYEDGIQYHVRLLRNFYIRPGDPVSETIEKIQEGYEEMRARSIQIAKLESEHAKNKVAAEKEEHNDV